MLGCRLKAGEFCVESCNEDDDDDDEERDMHRRIVRFFDLSGEGAINGEIDMSFVVDSSPSAGRRRIPSWVVGDAAGFDGDDMRVASDGSGENSIGAAGKTFEV